MKNHSSILKKDWNPVLFKCKINYEQRKNKHIVKEKKKRCLSLINGIAILRLSLTETSTMWMQRQRLMRITTVCSRMQLMIYVKNIEMCMSKTESKKWHTVEYLKTLTHRKYIKFTYCIWRNRTEINRKQWHDIHDTCTFYLSKQENTSISIEKSCWANTFCSFHKS